MMTNATTNRRKWVGFQQKFQSVFVLPLGDQFNVLARVRLYWTGSHAAGSFNLLVRY
jgi:hypothetical protein